MAGRRDKQNGKETTDTRVFLRNAQGNYLAQDAHGVFFTDNRSAAVVLSYQADRVPEQLELIRKSHGVSLVADPVPLEEIYETCDRCKELFVPFMIAFDGRRFLCRDCGRPTGAQRV